MIYIIFSSLFANAKIFKSIEQFLVLIMLDFGLQEIQRLQDEADKANKHSSVFERENQRFEIQVKDLSQQVSSLDRPFLVESHDLKIQVVLNLLPIA